MRAAGASLLAIFLLTAPAIGEPARRTENVVLIVTDGLRWQEVFRGGDPDLMNEKPGGVEDPGALRRDFLREDARARREALLPFFWTVIAKEGQIYGNRDEASVAQVTNRYKFSYPGYNEMITGSADPRIDKNGFGLNPNVSVFEWLNGFPELRDRVAVIGSWGVFPAIFNRERSRLAMCAGWDPPVSGRTSPRQALLNDLYRTTTRYFSDMPFDSLLHQALLDYVASHSPRVLFVGYGETDEWAHDGRYDLLLRSAHQVDAFIRELWIRMQSLPQYKGKTTFIITTDHGRGSGDTDWKNHGRDVDGAENIWIALLGPDTPPLGERKRVSRVTQGQIAATIAALLGRDYHAAFPASGPPLEEAIGKDASLRSARRR
ncbi:MAG TPA: AP protein [Thermoanaerobaculia bacterium]|jgi:hypothetical protein